MHQIQFQLELCPRPHVGGAHRAPPDLLAGFRGSYFYGKGRGGRTWVRRRGKGFFFIFKHSWAPKRSWKISHGDPEKSWIFL